MILKLVIFLHILSATVWVGGHLILSVAFLPKALKENDFSIVKGFDSRFGIIGIPSLLVLIASGIYISTVYTPDLFSFDFNNHHIKDIALKYLLLIISLSIGLHAKFVVKPKGNLKSLAYHIIAVTILGIFLVFLGFSARSGGLL
jgi:putative copper export protein